MEKRAVARGEHADEAPVRPRGPALLHGDGRAAYGVGRGDASDSKAAKSSASSAASAGLTW
jgi:hypothetical protein